MQPIRRQISLIKPYALLIEGLALTGMGVAILAQAEWFDTFLRVIIIIVLATSSVATAFVLLGDHFNSLWKRYTAVGTPDEYEPEEPSKHWWLRVRHGWRTLLSFLRLQDRRFLALYFVVSAALTILTALFPQLISNGIGLIFGIWALATGVVHVMYCYQLHATHSRGLFRYVLLAAVSLSFGLLMLIDPITQVINVRLTSGLYLLIHGVHTIIDFVISITQWNIEHSGKLTRLRILPPVLITAFLPSWLVDWFNRMLENHNADHVYEKPAEIVQTSESDMADEELTILFHMGHHVAFGFGHCDVALGDTVYSFGCYDDASNRFMRLYSDGVFMVAKLHDYLEYCHKWQRKTVIGYTLRLTKEQRDKVASRIDAILSECRPWYPDERNSKAVGQSGHACTFFPIRYYKVTHGPFQLYSPAKTNCVAMAEIMVGEMGLKLMPAQGIITPGSYYAFLDRKLKDPDSPVIRRTIYRVERI